MSTSAASSIMSSSSCRDVFASAWNISKNLQGVLDCDGLIMLHCSKWRCLASTYSAEILDLIELMGPNFDKLEQLSMNIHIDGPLHALQQAVQEGEACMQEYIPASSDGNYHSWLVNKALKLVMSTDVVDVHLHNFLWASSIVLEQFMRITGFRDREKHLLEQERKLQKIWSKEDADGDLRTSKSFLIELKGEYRDNNEIWQLVDFILHKLSHVEEVPHNHVTPGSLPPYMCIHSNQCLHTDKGVFRNDHTVVREVVWLGGTFVLKSFKHVIDDDDHLFEGEAEIDNFFNREAAIQARVWHSHVVPLVCCTHKPPGLLMELLQEDLEALIKRSREISQNDSPFPLLMAVDLMMQIAKGMEYLHSDALRIIHRDLKSANILVSFPVNSNVGDSNHASTSVLPQVHLKIADFGVSKAKYDYSVYTTRNQGTVSWMAPEVYEEDGGSNGRKYSNKADVYSFGIVCYEILTGRPPFRGPNKKIRKRVSQGEKPLLPPHCPPALSNFIQMCWHTDPTERPTFVQICRILRCIKACILLADRNNEAQLLGCLISPKMCAHIDAMIDHSLAGRTFQPKALGIPLEMHFCLRDFGFHNIDNLAWVSWKDELLTFRLESRYHSAITREQRMCEGSVGWSLFVGRQEVPPHFKELRRFRFEELRIATNKFSTLMVDSASGISELIMNCIGKAPTNALRVTVYLGELEQGQEVAVASITSSSEEQIPRESVIKALGWCQELDTLFLVFPCHARKLHLGHIDPFNGSFKSVLRRLLKNLHSGSKEIMEGGK